MKKIFLSILLLITLIFNVFGVSYSVTYNPTNGVVGQSNIVYNGSFTGNFNATKNTEFQQYNIQNWGATPATIDSGTVTSNSANLFCADSPFTPASVGMSVKVSGGGKPDICLMNTNFPWGNTIWAITNNYDLVGTISSIVNPSNVVLSVTAQHSVTSRVVFGYDSSAAIQAAWTFAVTNNANVELDFPVGDYIIATNINYFSGGGWTNHANSQIYTPSFKSTTLSGIEKFVRLAGPTPSRLNPYNNYTQTPAYGAIIESFAYGTNNGLMSVFDTRDLSGNASIYESGLCLYVPGATYNGLGYITPSIPYSECDFDFENLTFISTYDSDMAFINGAGALGLSVEDSTFLGNPTATPGTGRTTWALSGTNSYSLIAPGPYNDNHIFLRDVDIQNFWTGYASGGNTISSGKLLILECWNGIQGIGIADADTYQDYSPQQVKNEFVGPQLAVTKTIVNSQDSFVSPYSYPNLLVQTNIGLVSFSAEVFITDTLNPPAVQLNRGLPYLQQNVQYLPDIIYDNVYNSGRVVQSQISKFSQLQIGTGTGDYNNRGGGMFQDSGFGYWGNLIHLGPTINNNVQYLISMYGDEGSAGGVPNSVYFDNQRISGGTESSPLPIVVMNGLTVTNALTVYGVVTGNGAGLTGVLIPVNSAATNLTICATPTAGQAATNFTVITSQTFQVTNAQSGHGIIIGDNVNNTGVSGIGANISTGFSLIAGNTQVAGFANNGEFFKQPLTMQNASQITACTNLANPYAITNDPTPGAWNIGPNARFSVTVPGTVTQNATLSTAINIIVSNADWTTAGITKPQFSQWGTTYGVGALIITNWVTTQVVAPNSLWALTNATGVAQINQTLVDKQ